MHMIMVLNQIDNKFIHFLLMHGFLSFGCKQNLQLPHFDALHPSQFLHLFRLDAEEVPVYSA